jgi:hypothetical protein
MNYQLLFNCNKVHRAQQAINNHGDYLDKARDGKYAAHQKGQVCFHCQNIEAKGSAIIVYHFFAFGSNPVFGKLFGVLYSVMKCAEEI